MISSNENIWWTNFGNLSEFKSTLLSGCYVFVWDKKRIIYVGTSSDIEKRLHYHVNSIRSGKRPVWRVDDNDDIYDLMKNFKSNKKKYLKLLANNGYAWINYENTSKVENLLNPTDDFDENWKDYIESEFLPKIEVWATGINGNKTLATTLESRIQILLRSAFNLGSLYSKFNQSWLGKVEHPNINNRVKFNFQNYPETDEQTLEVLNCINDTYLENISFLNNGPRKKKIKIFNPAFEQKIKYTNRKKPINENVKRSVKIRVEEIKELKKKYKFYGTPWTKVEDNIIKLLVENKVKIDDISSELSRSPKEISERLLHLKLTIKF